ncbi:MAG: tetraacyldisaccharide 4'-kinase [Nitrospinota bacterium]
MSELFYKIISPNRKWYWSPFFWFLRFISFFYLLGHHFRLWAYRWGIFPRRSLDCRVISVGNLTLGGTGKTPFVMMIAETLRGNGFKPAILTRGYGGKSKKPVNVVCDGKSLLLSPDRVGDEAVMMAEKLKNVPILTGSDRFQTGRYALENYEVDTLILDDGFQHLALRRDLDILLCDHQRPLGNNHLFPAGELREPPSETRRADMVCFTRYFGGPIKFPQKYLGTIPQIKTHLRLDSLINMENGEVCDVEILKNQPVVAFCGIANPEGFRKILQDTQVQLKIFKAFPDHHDYTLNDIKQLESKALQEGAKFILVSEKDAVKLKDMNFTLPFYKVVIDLEILEGREIFNKQITTTSRGGSKK